MKVVAENRTRDELASFDRANSTREDWRERMARSSSSRLQLESDNSRLSTLLAIERKALYDEEVVRELATR